MGLAAAERNVSAASVPSYFFFFFFFSFFLKKCSRSNTHIYTTFLSWSLGANSFLVLHVMHSRTCVHQRLAFCRSISYIPPSIPSPFSTWNMNINMHFLRGHPVVFYHSWIGNEQKWAARESFITEHEIWTNIQIFVGGGVTKWNEIQVAARISDDKWKKVPCRLPTPPFRKL